MASGPRGMRTVRKARRLATLAVIGTGCLAAVLLSCLTDLTEPNGLADPGTRREGAPKLFASHGRSLLGLPTPNCTPPAIEQFPPPPFFTPAQRRRGGVIVHVLMAAYMFVALALVCDDYFVPACESISDTLQLQSDVAGATFMAAGSSAPELATAVIGVFVAKDDIGLGAVVGSAVFNIMLVTSLCALFAGSVVYLQWWPLVRDCVFYTISIVALVIVILDEAVYWYEAAILLILYAIYIVVMIFNRQLETLFVSSATSCCRQQEDEKCLVQLKSIRSLNEESGDTTPVDASKEDLKEVVEPESPLSMPSHPCRRLAWLICLPLTLSMYLTVPDCRTQRWRRYFILTFVMSILWISLFSYIMVWMITIVGHTVHIPDTIMGLTFIAAGASVPDAIASILVVRDGYGDMAISNAVGSNVFDILICLGLPWLLSTLGPGTDTVIQVYSAGLTYSSLTLLGTVVFLIVATHCNGWRLTKMYGVILLFVYICFNALASLYELNVFGYVHPPDCPSIY